MIRCKDSVRFSKLRREVWRTFPIIEETFKYYEIVPTITCGTEAHGQDDPHTNGYALDVRSKNLPDIDTKRIILNELIQSLGPDYTVLLENEGKYNEHFHIQIKKGLWRTLLSGS